MEKLRAVMEKAGCAEKQIGRFVRRVETFLGDDGATIAEADIQPVETVVRMTDIKADSEQLRGVVILKLNGGLGTSMGLTGPKGLLAIREGQDFYQILLRQLDAFEERHRFRPPLLFMNSFSTEAATTERLRELGFSQRLPWSFLQSQVPKLDESGRPVDVEQRYAWCPPGHGDLYASLLDSGLRDRLLEEGYRYLFVSNIDNLGAVLDSRPPAYMMEHGLPFLMEVTRRGENDRKGGHLAQTPQGGLLLREVAQCPAEDLPAFQDIATHRFFNTNNLWVDLQAIDESWTDLPLIINRKPVIPHDLDSPQVIQLESAMGAAIGTVERAQAMEVGRDRFFPVKTTNDLFGVRSDLYQLDEAGVLRATVEQITAIDLDPKHYKMIQDFDELVRSAPSLKECRRLKVRGPVIFSAQDELSGEVELTNPTSGARTVSELSSVRQRPPRGGLSG